MRRAKLDGGNVIAIGTRAGRIKKILQFKSFSVSKLCFFFNFVL